MKRQPEQSLFTMKRRGRDTKSKQGNGLMGVMRFDLDGHRTVVTIPSAHEINVASIHIRNERLQHQRNAERANYRAATIFQRRKLQASLFSFELVYGLTTAATSAQRVCFFKTNHVGCQ